MKYYHPLKLSTKCFLETLFNRLLPKPTVIMLSVNKTSKTNRRSGLASQKLSCYLSGVTLAMGLTNFSEMRDYWSISSFTSVPWFCSIFSRSRFEQTLTYVQLVNNENTLSRERPEYKLYTSGSLPEILSKNYRDCYTPERELAID